MLTYKSNPKRTTHAAHCGSVRVGYIEVSNSPDRWIWSLNTIQPKGGRASGIVANEAEAKTALETAWAAWLDAAGLKEQT